MGAPTFPNEDEEAQYCLSTLRDGTDAEKIDARERLAAIFSRRGLHEEAAELYESNLRAGVRSPALFERLSETYRQLGDHRSAEAALAEARRLRPAAGDDGPTVADQSPPSSPPSVRRTAAPGGVATDSAAQPASGPVGVSEARTAMVEPDAAIRDAAERGDGVLRPAVGRADAAADSPGPPARALADDPKEPAGALQAATAKLPVQAPSAAPAAEADSSSDEAATLPDRSRRRGRAVPGALVVAAAIVGLIVAPVVLLALLVVNPIALYLEGRAAGPTVDAAAETPPVLMIAPGATTTWYLQAGRSVSGLWASSGLRLTLDQEVEGVGHEVIVTDERPQSWGETITIVERRGQGRANQETIVPATFVAPASLPPTGTVLTGRIAGSITAPRLGENSQFTTTTEPLNVAVQFQVVSGFELWADRFGNAVRMFFEEDRWLLVTIGALLTWCILAGGAALALRGGHR